MSTSLRSVGHPRRSVDYACGALGRAPCIHARLHRLATNPGEKCGLGGPPPDLLREALSEVCRRHGAADLSSDPIRFPRRYRDPRDAEAAAFLAASFAFGRVSQIHRFLDSLFAALSPSPWGALTGARPVPFRGVEGLSHRFISSRGVFLLLRCLRRALREHGSLEALYRAVRGEPADLRSGLAAFLGWFREAWGESFPRERNFLLPDPRHGSACKRHNLFLRWMVRGGDGVDLGLWTALSPGELIVPVDTHLARLGRWLGLTRRAAADWKTAEEITRAFRSVCPEDPLRFDFPLTRVGILGECTSRRRGRCRICPLARVCAVSEERQALPQGGICCCRPSAAGIDLEGDSTTRTFGVEHGG